MKYDRLDRFSSLPAPRRFQVPNVGKLVKKFSFHFEIFLRNVSEMTPFELCDGPAGLDLAHLNNMKKTSTTFFKNRLTIPVKNRIGLLLVVMVCFAGLNVQAKKSGGSDTGGGTTVINSAGRRVLLDLFSYNQPRSRGIELASRTLRTQKVDYLCIGCGSGKGLLSRDRKLIAFVDQKLQWLQSQSPSALSSLRQALTVPVIVLNAPAPLLSNLQSGQFEAHADFSNIPVEVQQTARLAAGFSQGQLIGLSAPEFNLLSLEDQAGLLIHEALRFLQIQNKRPVTDSQLQSLVLSIISADSSLLSVPLLESVSTSVRSAELLERKKVACDRLQAVIQKYSGLQSLNWSGAQELCQNQISDFSAQLELLQKAYSNAFQNRPALLRAAETPLQAQEILQLTDGFEALLLSSLTGALSQNDPTFNSIILAAPRTFDFVTLDEANHR